ncbi:hypothetical protein ABT131_33745 [Streptomyces sp900105245]|uniref:Lipoprotein n=1 Tax=Streptomyces albidocamelliae TaxID=2981135 RepID=A0ABY6EJP2_9ACTN|nr:hypothetical protein [Streptomyces sp. HUAS 14-6]UXY33328.1 hypothetical protein N8I86_00385 [Streptomyces sp. HUAS 14-6]
MTPDDAKRAHRKITLLTACVVAALAAPTGYDHGGWGNAAVVMVIAGGGGAVGGYLVRHRLIAALTKSAGR